MVEVLGRYSNHADQGKRIEELLQIVPAGIKVVKTRTRQLQQRLSPAEAEKLVADYESGVGIKKLAVRYHIHRHTVGMILDRYGIIRRPRGIPPERLGEVIASYQAGSSLAAIAAELSVAPGTVRLALQRAAAP